MFSSKVMQPEPSVKMREDGSVEELSEAHFFSAQLDLSSESRYPHCRGGISLLTTKQGGTSRACALP
jgi:hypothetical protein